MEHGVRKIKHMNYQKRDLVKDKDGKNYIVISKLGKKRYLVKNSLDKKVLVKSNKIGPALPSKVGELVRLTSWFVYDEPGTIGVVTGIDEVYSQATVKVNNKENPITLKVTRLIRIEGEYESFKQKIERNKKNIKLKLIGMLSD